MPSDKVMASTPEVYCPHQMAYVDVSSPLQAPSSRRLGSGFSIRSAKRKSQSIDLDDEDRPSDEQDAPEDDDDDLSIASITDDEDEDNEPVR